MLNFNYHNPVNILFGAGQITQLKQLINTKHKILLLYGAGSIKNNGIYQEVITQLKDKQVVEFGGVEVNPDYDTLMQAVTLARTQKIDFIVAVGGGSVIDGAKFISAAINYPTDPWEILEGNPINSVISFGAVLTLPATGSEMNCGSVISHRIRGLKQAFRSVLVYPQFAILDPQTSYTLPIRQLRNGIVDPFIHVTEQYLTTNENTAIQDGFAETILKTLIDLAPQVIAETPPKYGTRANWMWAATNALNGLIGLGVKHDWATHQIGHQLTVHYELDHAQTLAIIAPQVWRYKKEQKEEKLLQFAHKVWGIHDITPSVAIEKAIRRTVVFFEQLGIKTTLSAYQIVAEAAKIAKNIHYPLGEHQDMLESDIIKIIEMAQ